MENILTPSCIFKVLDADATVPAALNPGGLGEFLSGAAAKIGLILSEDGIKVNVNRLYDGYGEIDITERHLTINAENREAELLALGYLRQLSAYYEERLPICSIRFEKPDQGYRGIHLDCSRHFFSTKEIRRLLSVFTVLGFNIFHWHLTDDQGWRFPVEGYPLLKEIASKRLDPEYDDGRMEGGFYSVEDLKDIVGYAEALGITVIPEIELPGHATALLAAYPEFGCTGKKLSVPKKWGVFEDVMNPTSTELWTFLDRAIETLAKIFPGPYIHIGGDECPHVQWETHEGCQEIMKENDLKTTMELQGWFTTKVARIVASYGKRAMGWDEIVDAPKIDRNVIIMSWRGLEGARKATSRGHQVILCPEAGGGCYFDRHQSTDDWEPGNLTVSPLKCVYDLDFNMKELKPEERALILGGQGNMWTEKLRFGRLVEYMYFPRAFALSENLWRGDERNWDEFLDRRKAIFRILVDLDMAFSTASWS